MAEPVVFYDLKREVSDKTKWAWSPNTWRTRLALNIKGVPHKTEWLDFTEVGPKMQELGLKEKTDEPLKYTVPTIYDPNTKRIINDSQAIAEYLDEQYPGTTKLFPPGTRALQAAFLTNLHLVTPIFPVCLHSVGQTVAEHDREYFWESRKAFLGGKSVEEVLPTGDALVEAVKGFEKALEDLAARLDVNGEAKFFGEDAPIYLDVVVASSLLFITKVLPEDHLAHQALKDTKGGRWARYLEGFSKWTEVV